MHFLYADAKKCVEAGSIEYNGESVLFGLEDENLIQRQLDMALGASHHTTL